MKGVGPAGYAGGSLPRVFFAQPNPDNRQHTLSRHDLIPELSTIEEWARARGLEYDTSEPGGVKDHDRQLSSNTESASSSKEHKDGCSFSHDHKLLNQQQHPVFYYFRTRSST
eukprot:12177167-Heterocapsa_arctica.AAC.1